MEYNAITRPALKWAATEGSDSQRDGNKEFRESSKTLIEWRLLVRTKDVASPKKVWQRLF